MDSASTRGPTSKCGMTDVCVDVAGNVGRQAEEGTNIQAITIHDTATDTFTTPPHTRVNTHEHTHVIPRVDAESIHNHKSSLHNTIAYSWIPRLRGGPHRSAG